MMSLAWPDARGQSSLHYVVFVILFLLPDNDFIKAHLISDFLQSLVVDNITCIIFSSKHINHMYHFFCFSNC